MRRKGTKLGEGCPKVRLSQDRMPVFSQIQDFNVFGIFTFGIFTFGIFTFRIFAFGIFTFGIFAFGIVSFGKSSWRRIHQCFSISKTFHKMIKK